MIKNYGNETSEDIERRIRTFVGSTDLDFYVGFHLKCLSKNFLREMEDKVEITNILTNKYNNFNLGLQDEEKVGWNDFIRIYFKNCIEFVNLED